jgi:hypothetical protein
LISEIWARLKDQRSTINHLLATGYKRIGLRH